MIRKEIKINLNEILNFIKFAGYKIPTEHYSWDSEKHDWIEAINEAIKMVEQEPKTGHWEYGYAFPDGNYCKCSECKEIIKCIYPMHYCPNCGAKMVESEE